MFPQSEDPQFFVKGGGGAFANRQKSIFDQLDAAEKQQSTRRHVINDPPPPENNSIEVEPFNVAVRSSRRNRHEMKQFRGKESIFKRPDALPPRFKAKSIPDYHKNPHKWVKYSLGDVSQADMSNHSNTAAAFSFLQEIAARKAAEAANDNLDNSSQISFRKPRSKPQLTLGSVVVETNSRQTTDDDKPSFKSSKLVMPEYVVGVSKKKERKRIVVEATETSDDIPFSWPEEKEENKTDEASGTESKKQRKVRKSKASEIPLGHLMEYDDEDQVT